MPALPPGGGLSEIVRTRLNAILAGYAEVFPDDFGSVQDSATAALQAAHDWCWNGGSIRGLVRLRPNTTYIIDDPDNDGIGLTWKDGVPLEGAGSTSLLSSSVSNLRILRRIRTGVARMAWMRDFWINGGGVAKTGIEFYGSASDSAENLHIEGCKRNIVVDGSQNLHLTNIVSKNAVEWNYSILNGAGSILLDTCYADGGGVGHILIDNDPSYPGSALAGMGLAYVNPQLIIIRGGIYERQTSGGALKCSLRVNTASQVIADSGANFSVVSTAETIIDDGRWVMPASFASSTSLTVAAVDVTGYFPVGRRIRVTDSGGAVVYGVVSSSSFSTNTTVTLTMDSGQSIPNLALTLEIGRSDDSSTATWTAGVSATRLRDIYVFGASLTGPVLRGASFDAIYDSPLLSSCSGDWFEVSQPCSIMKPKGTLASGKLRAKHVRGVNSGSAQIGYTPLQQANSGTFETPGHATSIAYSNSGQAFRWYDAVAGQHRIIPTTTSGSGAPTFSALHVGQHFIDTTNAKAYEAYRTGNGSGDWLLLN